MGRGEYSSRVRGMGFGSLPIRPTSQSSASHLTQEAAFNTQMNEMMRKWEEEKRKSDERWEEERRRAEEDRRRAHEERRRTDDRIATHDRMMEKMEEMIEDLATANASLVANTSATLDIASPNIMGMRSSVATQPRLAPNMIN
jgi:phosphoglycolate phosphatase-like HAD superfamily hydrolase